MASLEQFHQCKSHDKTDSTPFEASQNGLKHPAQTLAQATTALKRALDLGATLNWRVHQLSAQFQNQTFEGASTALAREKQTPLKARETLRSRQLSFWRQFSSFLRAMAMATPWPSPPWSKLQLSPAFARRKP